MNDTDTTGVHPRRFSSRKARVGIAAAIGTPLVAAALLAVTIPAAAAQPGGPASTPVSSVAAIVQPASDAASGDVGSVVEGQAKADPKLNLKDGTFGAVSAGPDGVVTDQGAGAVQMSVASGDVGSVVQGQAKVEGVPTTPSSGSISANAQAPTAKG